MPMPVLTILVDRLRQRLADDGQRNVSQDEAIGLILAEFLAFERERVLNATHAALQEIDRRSIKEGPSPRMTDPRLEEEDTQF